MYRRAAGYASPNDTGRRSAHDGPPDRSQIPDPVLTTRPFRIPNFHIDLARFIPGPPSPALVWTGIESEDTTRRGDCAVIDGDGRNGSAGRRGWSSDRAGSALTPPAR